MTALKKPRLLALLIVACCMAVTIALIPVTFETNDDYGMMGYVSGARTGEPEADTIFSLYLWGKLQSCLYTLAPGVPWYPLSFLLLIALSLWLFYTELLRLSARKGLFWLGVLVSVALYVLLFVYYSVRLQFTVVSAFCGLAALTLMLLRCREGELKKQFPSYLAVFVLTLFSVNIRSKVALLLLGSGCVVCGLECVFLPVSHFSMEQKRAVRNVFAALLVMGVAVGISVGVNQIHNQRNEGWAEFRE